MIRSRTIIRLITFIIIPVTLYGANYRKLQDCLIPLQNNNNQFMQCYSGQIIQPVEKAEFVQIYDIASQARSILTSFFITRDVVTRKEYLRYLKNAKKRVNPILKTLNNSDLSKPILGLNWNEAQDYCRFFAMELPSESQLEYSLFETNLLSKPELEWEYARDSYKPNSRDNLSKKNPLQQAPSSYRIIRSNIRRSNFKGILRTKREKEITFRCVSHAKSFMSKEILLNYRQNYPNSNDSELHLLRIDSIPSGARIYADPNYHHYIGKTPYFGKVKPGKTLYTLKAPKQKPKLIQIIKKKNLGQQLILNLKAIPPRLKEDTQRGNRMILVPSGRVSIGSSEWDKELSKLSILNKKINRDELNSRTIRRYLNDEGPDRIVYVKEFYMDETEVTNQQYMNYVKNSGAMKPRCWHVKKYNQDNQPVVCVDWTDANSFCNYYGKSLPTEIQYEKAVKQASHTQIKAWIKRPQKIASDKTDNSRYDIKDLAGNVMEWNYDWYDSQAHLNWKLFESKPFSLIKKEKVIRGASYATHRLDRRISKRRHKNPEHYALDLGFRCVHNL